MRTGKCATGRSCTAVSTGPATKPSKPPGCRSSVTPRPRSHTWQAKPRSFDSPDETRPFEGKGQALLVNLGGKAIGKGTFEPGWKWSENVKPIAQTDSCQAHHVGYCLSGAMTVHMNDGTSFEINAGDVFDIPPGHDAGPRPSKPPGFRLDSVAHVDLAAALDDLSST